MEFRENADRLMSQVGISESMHRAIMDGKKMRRKRKNIWRQAAAPAAAAVLIMSTMYVGAGYLIENTPIRELFMAKDDSALPVPEGQERMDIYEEILDPPLSSFENQAAAGEESNGEGSGIDGSVQSGNFGRKIIDNELFSIELLETTCAGRELSLSYILTKKTDELVSVNVTVDTDYLEQWNAAGGEATLEQDRMLLRSSFGDSFRWDKLPEGCGYELAENQELCIVTQLGKRDYTTGTYTLYADATLCKNAPVKDDKTTEGAAEPKFVVVPEEDIERGFFTAPIEIVGNDSYGLSLQGTTDKTEGEVHFAEYDVYVSPMTVYLTLSGTYKGEMSSIWGMHNSHDIVIGFADGTQTRSTVLLSAMGYGDGEIKVDMRALFDTVIDPQAVTRVLLDDVVIMGEQDVVE